MLPLNLHPVLVYRALLAAGISFAVAALRWLWLDLGDAALGLLARHDYLQLMASGLVAGAVGWLVQLLRQKLSELLWTTLTIKSGETEIWEALVAYVTANDMLKSNVLTAKRRRAKPTTWRKRYQLQQLGKRESLELEYTHGEGCRGIIEFEGETVFIDRHRDGAMQTVGWNKKLVQPEVVTLRAWGRGHGLLQRFLEAAVRHQRRDEQEAGEISILTISNDWPGGWQKALTKKVRSLESVVLDGTLQHDLLVDMRQFQRGAAWYEEAGIPYRRGYLLHGPPGCGKTSLCQALAGALQLDVCMLSLSNKQMTDNELAANLRDAPASSIVLLEDVDAVFVGRELATASSGMGVGAGGSSTGVSFSGLLNAIDGAAAQEGRMLFMTTNHIEKLDPALIRPGRCDVRVLVGNASRDQMRRLFVRFFGGPGAEANAKSFACKLPEGELSMAKLQGFLLEHKADSTGTRAVEAVPQLLLQAKPKAIEAMPAFEHLRRLGLGRFEPVFSYHGFDTKAQIDGAGLTAADCAHWDFNLACDPHAMRRLKLLLEGSGPFAASAARERLLEDYALAELSTVQQAFIGTFFGSDASVRRAGGGDHSRSSVVAEVSPPVLRRQPSSECVGLATGSPDSGMPCFDGAFARCTATGVGEQPSEAEEERLAKRFVAALTSTDGKSLLSGWQLRWLLTQEGHDPIAAIVAAERLGKEARGEAHALESSNAMVTAAVAKPRPMSAYDVIRRLALDEKYAHALEGKGHTTVRALQDLGGEDKINGIIKDGVAAALLAKVLKNEPQDAQETRGFQCPSRATARRIFRRCFPADTDSAHAAAFAEAISDADGFGLASFFMIEAHLKRYTDDGDASGGARAAAEAAEVALVRVERTPAPVPQPIPEPTEWVHSWLKEADLEKWSQGFIRAEICTEDDLLAEPALEIGDLEDPIGVKTLGARRKIMRMIDNLHAQRGAACAEP